MAFLNIVESAGMVKGAFDDVFIPVLDGALAIQTVSSSTASVLSAAFQGNTRVIMVISDAALWVKVGAAPTATAVGASMYLAAGTYVPLAVNGGDKIAMIDA